MHKLVCAERDMFTLSLCFIRASEGIWFYLSRAICVSLIMFSQCILRVFSLGLLSSPDLSPEISLSLCCAGQSLCTRAYTAAPPRFGMQIHRHR